jgi:hypothetical protein
MANFNYKNPVTLDLVNFTETVIRSDVFGTNYSVLGTGGYMEVWSIDDLKFNTYGITGSIVQDERNIIPVRYYSRAASFQSNRIDLNNDGISSGRRRLGMLVYVHETDTVYQYVIPDYETLYNNAESSGAIIETTDYFQVSSGSQFAPNAAGQAFIDAWLDNSIEGVSGATSSNSRWRVFWGTDWQVTGGTIDYNSTGDLNLNSNSGNTVTISGLKTITGGTFFSGTSTLELYNNLGDTISVTGFTGGSGGTSGSSGSSGTSGSSGSSGTSGSSGSSGTSGSSGSSGTSGSSGSSGTSGSSGSSGTSGSSGSSGTSGSSGSSGTSGSSGSSGTSGSSGSSGTSGSSGSSGTSGISGVDGTNGTSGSSGSSGTSGSSGSSGTSGSSGSSGTSGSSGSSGTSGSSGSSGTSGSSGSSGTSGSSGSSGTSGSSGSSGTSGSSGSSGTSGSNGSSGTSGSSGSSGTSGSSGSSGTSGSSGSSGTSGSSGSSGTSGSSGSSGTSGSSGSSGTSGSSGSSGTSGNSFTGGTVTYDSNGRLVLESENSLDNINVDGFKTITGGTYLSATTTLELYNNLSDTIQITGFTTGGGDISVSANTGLGIIDPNTLYTIYNSNLSADLEMNEDVGGLDAGTRVDDLTGKTLVQLFNDILFPTALPTYTKPTVTLQGLNNQTLEVGTTKSIVVSGYGDKNDAGDFTSIRVRTGTTSPNVDVVIDNSPTESSITNIPDQFGFTNPNNPNTRFTSTQLSYTLTIPEPTIGEAASTVMYDAEGDCNAGLPKLDNKGNTDTRTAGTSVDTPQQARTNLNSTDVTITGVYPYWYGVSTSQPTINSIQNAISGGTANKSSITNNQNDTITITFNASSEFLWFAHFEEYNTKQSYYVTDLNKGNFGSSGLFETEVIGAIDSPDGYWSGVNYKIYISNYQTTTTGFGSMDLNTTIVT